MYIYYSINAKNVPVQVFNKYKYGNNSIETIQCSIGKNAMDCVIATHIGSLINKYGDEKNYYIVSKDNDYQGIVNFWKGISIKCISSVMRVHNPKYDIEKIVKTVSNNSKVSKNKHKLDIRSMIGTCIKGIKRPELDAMDAIFKAGNINTYISMINKEFGSKGNEYVKKLKPLFDKLKKSS